MKKIMLIFILVLCISGCTNNNERKDKEIESKLIGQWENKIVSDERVGMVPVTIGDFGVYFYENNRMSIYAIIITDAGMNPSILENREGTYYVSNSIIYADGEAFLRYDEENDVLVSVKYNDQVYKKLSDDPCNSKILSHC